jgi:hypothetical protein
MDSMYLPIEASYNGWELLMDKLKFRYLDGYSSSC